MVDWSNSRLHLESLSTNNKPIPNGDEYPFGNDAWAENRAADTVEVINSPLHRGNESASNCGTITKQSGNAWCTGGESAATPDDTLLSSENAENVETQLQLESLLEKDMKEVERQLPWTLPSPVTQLYETSASGGIAEDTITIYQFEPEGDKETLSPSYTSLKDQSFVLQTEDSDEYLPDLRIEQFSDYLNELPLVTIEDVDRDLESLLPGLKKQAVHYLWISLPKDRPEHLYGTQGVNGDNGDSLVDIEIMANSWLFVCLVYQKVQNITFATNLHSCLNQLFDAGKSIPMDLTEAARRHWYDGTMPKSCKTKKLGVFHRLGSSNKRSQTQVEVHHVQPRNLSVKNEVKSIQCQTDAGKYNIEPRIDQTHRCMVYGCIKRFANKSLLHSHLDIGKHTLICPKTECAHFIFDSLGVFQNHIFMQHPEQEWKLFLSPQSTARLNSEFDNRQTAKEPVRWSGTTSKARSRYRTQTWDF